MLVRQSDLRCCLDDKFRHTTRELASLVQRVPTPGAVPVQRLQSHALPERIGGGNAALLHWCAHNVGRLVLGNDDDVDDGRGRRDLALVRGSEPGRVRVRLEDVNERTVKAVAGVSVAEVGVIGRLPGEGAVSVGAIRLELEGDGRAAESGTWEGGENVRAYCLGVEGFDGSADLVSIVAASKAMVGDVVVIIRSRVICWRLERGEAVERAVGVKEWISSSSVLHREEDVAPPARRAWLMLWSTSAVIQVSALESAMLVA